VAILLTRLSFLAHHTLAEKLPPQITTKRLTKQETIEHIVNSQATGYLPMLAGSVVGAIWGNGTYFARDANYNHDYTESQVDVLTKQSQRKMLLNRVMVGE